MVRSAFVAFLLALMAPPLFAQGPRLSYLADPATEIPWAECYVRLDGGSRHKIPFLPMVNVKGAPSGTEKFSKDIRVNAPIVFVGDGIVGNGADAYGDLDVAGKAVIFSYDFPDNSHTELAKKFTLEQRVREAAKRKVAAVVLFSMAQEYPFPIFEESDPAKVAEVPIIIINRRSAETILASAGLDAEKLFEQWRSKGNFHSQALISKLNLRVEGKFDSVETPDFSFRFQPGTIPVAQREALAEVNEKSVRFIVDFFKDAKLTWPKAFTVYFPDYDSKLFYVHHWGKGLSSDAGVFMVFQGQVPDFGLAVHENTHRLLGQNWGESTSFFNEGLAKYAEAMATERNKNDAETVVSLKQRTLFPVAEMLSINIGSDQRTGVAYPAAGSFMQFLVQNYGLGKVKLAWQMAGREEKGPDMWVRVFGKPLQDLESEWLHSLAGRYHLDRNYVDDYLSKRPTTTSAMPPPQR